MITAIIMASGYSKRMGTKDKLNLKYNGKTLIEMTIDTILNCDFKEIILVAREENILELGKQKRIKVIKNENADKGISESIKLGVSNAVTSKGYMFIAADQPFLDVDIVNQLISKFNKYPDSIIIPIFEKRRGNPVIFPYELKEEFLNLNGDIGGKMIIEKHKDKLKFIEVDKGIKLFDIDTKEEYDYILKMKEDGNNV